MKRQFIKTALLMAFATMALSLSGAAQDFEKYTVKVDFDFMAGNKIMPAGEYTFQTFQGDSSRRLVLVRNTQTAAQAWLTVLPVTRTNADSAPLTFSKYGDQHFLTQVSLGDFTHIAVKTRTERKLAKQYARHTGPAKELVSVLR